MPRRMGRPLVALMFGLLSLNLVAYGVAAAQPPDDENEKVTICHKPGTPAEKTMQVPSQAVAAHEGHGDTRGPCDEEPPPPPDGCAAAQSDVCLDGDGIDSPQPGDFEVQVGDPLTPFPDDLATPSGLDLFDRAPVGVLTQDDDFHVEDPAFPGCPTAVRDGVHNLGQDCKVLDINGDLSDGEFVTADCEFGGCPSLKFHDADGDGDWDNGEDLVADNNNNNVFD